nr:immunoglobulin heavy chain junction region [Mus musculus]
CARRGYYYGSVMDYW